MAPAKTEPTAAERLLTFKLDNKTPVALDDLTGSLHALAESYDDYLTASGAASEEGARLYVHDLRTGSIIAVLQAVAEQGHILFGEHGAVPTLESVFDHADTLGGFLGGLNDVAQFFLGNPEAKERPTRKQAEQTIKLLEPVAKDNGSQINMQVSGSVNIGAIHNHYHYNSQEANAVQNSARRFLGPTIPTNETRQDEVLILDQMRGNPKARTGDRGIIESISKSAVKLAFSSEEIKKAIIESPDNPFQRVFVVDVVVKTADGKPALYKVLALKDSFEKP